MKKVNKVEQDLSFYSAFSYQAYWSFSNLCSVSHGHYSPPCHSLLTTGIRGESFRPSITRTVTGYHCKLSLRSSSGILLTSKLQSMAKVYPTKLVSSGHPKLFSKQLLWVEHLPLGENRELQGVSFEACNCSWGRLQVCGYSGVTWPLLPTH